jgi:DNA-binding NarL/FixJ family response regulator
VPKLRIFLADDHPIVRDGLRALVNGQRDMEVVGEAGDGANIVDSVRACGAQVVVMDVAMPGVGGAKGTEDLRLAGLDVKVLAVSAHEDRGYVEQMLAAGAAGYVVKRAAADDLIRAIRSVARGGTYIDPSIAGMLVAGRVRGGPHAKPGATLSDREAEVLRLVARGHPLKEIASSLEVSVRTIETYRARAMEKAGLQSRADVVRFAAERGWLTGP